MYIFPHALKLANDSLYLKTQIGRYLESNSFPFTFLCFTIYVKVICKYVMFVTTYELYLKKHWVQIRTQSRKLYNVQTSTQVFWETSTPTIMDLQDWYNVSTQLSYKLPSTVYNNTWGLTVYSRTTVTNGAYHRTHNFTSITIEYSIPNSIPNWCHRELFQTKKAHRKAAFVLRLFKTVVFLTQYKLVSSTDIR